MREIRVIGAPKIAQATKRVAAYCRVSSDSADQLASYQAQVSRYTALIGENPEWELAGIYADEGLTGTRIDTRDDFQRLMRDCAKGKVDRILTKSISRFARNTQDCLEAVRQLRILGVGVFFEKENIDTAELTSEMLLCVHSATAQQESISISQNMRWSYKRRMESGKFITCSAPYGYRLHNRDLIIYEQEAAIIRRIFEEYLSGKSKRQVADGLSADGIKKHAGSTIWRASDITHLLANEKYAGDAILQKTYTTDTLPFRSVINCGEMVWYHVQNSHPAIIDREVFGYARELAARRKTSSSQSCPHQSIRQRPVRKNRGQGADLQKHGEAAPHKRTGPARAVKSGRETYPCQRQRKYKLNGSSPLCPPIPPCCGIEPAGQRTGASPPTAESAPIKRISRTAIQRKSPIIQIKLRVTPAGASRVYLPTRASAEPARESVPIF